MRCVLFGQKSSKSFLTIHFAPFNIFNRVVGKRSKKERREAKTNFLQISLSPREIYLFGAF
jgi:hypothetical protein